MAAITLTATDICAGDNHYTLTVTGAAQHIEVFTLDDMLAAITDDEKRAFLRVLIRIAKIGRTRAQVRTALLNGYTVTI